MPLTSLFGSHAEDLHIRGWGTPSPPAYVCDWVSVFSHWADFHRRYHQSVQETEIGWWYRERPNLGFINAAVHAAGGSGIEEYRAEKGRGGALRTGRADYYAILGGTRPRHYSVEAKHAFVSLSTARESTRAAQMKKAILAARADVSECQDPAYRHGSLAVISVYHRVSSKEVGPATRSLPPDVELAVAAHRASQHAGVVSEFPAGLCVDFFPGDVPAHSHLAPARNGNPAYVHPGLTVLLGFTAP